MRFGQVFGVLLLTCVLGAAVRPTGAASAPSLVPRAGPGLPVPQMAPLLPPSALRPLLGGLPADASGRGPVPASTLAQQELTDQATLETRRPQVQWSPASATHWEMVPSRQTVRSGDRVRTGQGASARLVYFEGTTIDVEADTALLVQRLERSPGGNVLTTIFQAVGTTVSRVVQLTDAAAQFEIDTPAAAILRPRHNSPRASLAQRRDARDQRPGW